MTPDDLRARRAALKLSQRQLAELLGVSKSTVSHWEIGEQAIPPYVALALDTLAERQQRALQTLETADLSGQGRGDGI